MREVLLRHVLEHLDDIRSVLDDLWRILEPDDRAVIHVPHFTHFQALTHPEHRHAFHYNSLAMFTPEAREPYTNRLWHVKHTRLRFRSRFLEGVFNRYKYTYTTAILAYLFPAHEIEFVLHPLK